MNPGALGLAHSLSVNADLTFGLEAPYDHGSPLSQFSFGFNSRFLAFGYQFDRLENQVAPGILHTHAYRVALWGQNGRVGAGAAATWYSGGGDGGVGYDFGIVYRLSALVDLGAVAANVAHPTVRNVQLRTVFRPGVTVHTGRLFGLEAQGEWGHDGWNGYGFGTWLRLGGKTPLQLNARLDADRDLKRQAFTFGVTIGGDNRGAAFFTTSGDFKQGEALSLHGVSERALQTSRRR